MGKRHKDSLRQGLLTVFYGPMFSGKTSRIIAMLHVLSSQGKKGIIVKPSLDTRYGTESVVHNHDGRKEIAYIVDHTKPEVLLKKSIKTDVVIIDEIQFFPYKNILPVISYFRKMGISVVVAGLLYDYRRVPFETTSQLLGIADDCIELTSVCQVCGQTARHSQRINGGTRQVAVGERDQYQAVCSRCHVVYKG